MTVAVEPNLEVCREDGAKWLMDEMQSFTGQERSRTTLRLWPNQQEGQSCYLGYVARAKHIMCHFDIFELHRTLKV